MIFGIGTDIVRVDRMQQDLERFGEKFAARILAATELHEFQKNLRPAHFLARRFAVKEATAKAFGTGFVEGLYLRHIGITHNANGKPELVFTDRALEIAHANRVTLTHVSVSDEQDYAVAFVTLETAG